MPYLSPKRILELHAAALELGLDHGRMALFGSMPKILSALDKDPNPSKQLLLDLNALNFMPPSSPAEPCALETWLETAIHLYQHDPRTDALSSILEELKQARQTQTAQESPSTPQEASAHLPVIKAPPPRRQGLKQALLVAAGLVVVAGLWAYWRWPRCGNGRLEAGESCDDGNAALGDGCSADCAREFLTLDAGVHDAGTPDAGDGGDAGMNADGGDAGTDGDAGKPIPAVPAKVRVTCEPGTITMINGSKQSQQCGQPPATAAMHKDFPKELEWTAPSSPPNADPAWRCKCETKR